MTTANEDTLELAIPAISSEASRDAKVDFDFGAQSHLGLCRSNNEDHYAVVRRTRSRKILLTNVNTAGLSLPDDCAYVAIVADGVGGSGYGELASELILRIGWELATIEPSWVMKFRASDWSELREQVENLGRRMKQEFQSYAEADPRLAGMGTTWTCAYLMGTEALIAHVGDSRAYLFRNGNLDQLTRDHTYAQALEDAGVPPGKAAKFQHVLTNAFTANNAQISVDVSHLPFEDRDRLLLCSDGLYNMVSDTEIAATLAAQLAPQKTSDRLVELALEHGGKDNVTVVVADVHLAAQ